MGRFKVGDRVRDGAEKATVAAVDSNGRIRLNWDGFGEGDIFWNASEFEPIPSDVSPIRTVTRREIVPGKYGVVMIEESNAKPGTVLFDMWKANPDAEELRSAARIFNEIADVLDEQSAEAQKEAA